MIRSALSIDASPTWVTAALPLFQGGEVEAIEWSLDNCWRSPSIPDWVLSLLDDFSTTNSLYGHGVTFSACSAGIDQHHLNWCANMRKQLKCHRYVHLSEHFGLMLGDDFHQGAPLPLPLNAATLEIAQKNFGLLADSFEGRIGIENLALAYSVDDVEAQGAFLGEIVAPFDGFLLLDLHNIYCQTENFGCPPQEIIKSYPLDRVREIHLSGGSYAELELKGKTQIVRADTHDGPVPSVVFEMLRAVLRAAPTVELVVLEQLGRGLKTTEEQESFRNDFRDMKKIIAEASGRQ